MKKTYSASPSARCNRARYWADVEASRAGERQYYASHAERRRELARASYQRHKQDRIQRALRWARENPAKNREKDRRFSVRRAHQMTDLYLLGLIACQVGCPQADLSFIPQRLLGLKRRLLLLKRTYKLPSNLI